VVTTNQNENENENESESEGVFVRAKMILRMKE
jgi:hypothetical protein